MWNLGRVEEVYTGSDGLVRVVLVRTNRGSFKRAVTQVRVLPIEDPEDDDQQRTTRSMVETDRFNGAQDV